MISLPSVVLEMGPPLLVLAGVLAVIGARARRSGLPFRWGRILTLALPAAAVSILLLFLVAGLPFENPRLRRGLATGALLLPVLAIQARAFRHFRRESAAQERDE